MVGSSRGPFRFHVFTFGIPNESSIEQSDMSETASWMWWIRVAGHLLKFTAPRVLRHRLASRDYDLILACMLLLERKLSRLVLPLSAVHSLVSQIEPLESRLNFVSRPIPYSVELGEALDRLAMTSKLERFTIFDDGNHPQTVYRLTRVGRAIADSWLQKLPSSASNAAEIVSAKYNLDNPDREVRLLSSLEAALTV